MTRSAPLTILIPVRSNDSFSAIKRLSLRARETRTTATILTDDGSPGPAAEELREFCDGRGWTYQRLETTDLPFSLARARNAALKLATSEFVFFDDLDMVYAGDIFARIYAELSLLDETPFSFLSLPAVYLKESVTRQVFEEGGIDAFESKIVSLMQFENPRGSSANRVIESYAPASAILAMRRGTALAVGGYDEEFQGWGGEDRDFVFRLLAANPDLPRPSDFKSTRVSNLVDTHRYSGWRSLHRLHGEYLVRKGLYAFHLHHAKRAWRLETGRANIEVAARKSLECSVETELRPEDARAIRNSLLFSVYEDANTTKKLVERPEGGAWRARFKKLRRDPRRFFQDSRMPFGTIVARLFRERVDEA